jgi:hypothetical protein
MEADKHKLTERWGAALKNINKRNLGMTLYYLILTNCFTLAHSPSHNHGPPNWKGKGELKWPKCCPC